jgi:hypothetical protein
LGGESLEKIVEGKNENEEVRGGNLGNGNLGMKKKMELKEESEKEKKMKINI